MYDSLLYGYGTTLATFSSLSSEGELSERQRAYLFFDDFFRSFIYSDDHQKIYRDFLKCFNLNWQVEKNLATVKNTLAEIREDILSYGFERWVSKHLFDKENKVNPNEQFFIYMLYNYWAHILEREILSKRNVKPVIEEIACNIRDNITNTQNIFTTNFDTFFDDILKPDHLHGSFSIPLTKEKQIRLFHYNNGENFEYGYLFGTNGIEKRTRLERIRRKQQDRYQLRFFNDENLGLGHLLIFGMSFGKAEFKSEEFLNEYPEHEKTYVPRSVDGHILLRLNQKMKDDQLQKITASFYTDQDLEQLEYMFSLSELESISEFKHSDDIKLL
jgi:hypothetical protein